MRSKAVIAIMVMCLAVSLAYADSEGDVGRYALHSVELDAQPALILLDTKTGKIWIYQKEMSGMSASEQKFKGLTVEGVSYSLNDSKKLEQYLSELYAKDLITKDVKGFAETLSGEFSYFADLEKLKRINYELKLSQEAEKKE